MHRPASIRGTWWDDPAHFARSRRREFLRVGLLGGLGLTLGDILRAESYADDQAKAEGRRRPAAKAQSVIQIYLPGGAAHQELVDPKPVAPVEYRGEMDSVETALPGVRFNELMTRTAAIADKLTIIRSMTHTEAAHERGTHNMFTGYRPSPAITYPSFGSVVAMEYGSRDDLPAYVCIPTLTSPFAASGYLSSAYGPFSVGGDPARRTFQVRDLNLPEGVDDPRFTRRQGMLEAVDRHFKAQEQADGIDAMDTFYQQAYALLNSPQAREAFNVKSEPTSMIQAYGRSQAGARMLLARRLIEAGTRFVSLSYGAWDTHTYHFRTTRQILPPFDQALAALIDDLDQRGLLATTLVLVTTEFGRTPKVNAGAGRDHWPRVFSIILAGGGVQRGRVYGESNAIAAEPADTPVSPEDYAATIYHLLGIDPTRELIAPGNRPLRLVDQGRVLSDILA
jgi:hypothetical protein